METVTTQGTSVSYPVYDGHGNMVATLAKSGSGYQIGNRKSFGAWGDIRQGATTGDPRSRYCATSGHIADDESELIYMRARYYDQSTGRFLSSDDARQGMNWYIYCGNQPVNRTDHSGKSWTDIILGIFSIARLIAGSTEILTTSFKKIFSTVSGTVTMISGLMFLGAWFGLDLSDSVNGDKLNRFGVFSGNAFIGPAFAIAGIIAALDLGWSDYHGAAREAKGAISAYTLTLALFLTFDSMEQAVDNL